MKKIFYIIIFLIGFLGYSQTPFPSGIRLPNATKSDTLSGQTRIPVMQANSGNLINRYIPIDSIGSYITTPTNLSTTQTPTTVTINSDTGTDATIPLGDGVDAGVSINDYTNADKALVGSALQPSDNVSELTNDSGYLVSADLEGFSKTGSNATLNLINKIGHDSKAVIHVNNVNGAADLIKNFITFKAPLGGYIFEPSNYGFRLKTSEGYYANLGFPTGSSGLTANRDFQFPDSSGTFALLSDISSGVTLQQAVDNGNTVSLDSGNSTVSFLTGTTNNRVFDVFVGSGAINNSSLHLDNSQSSFINETGTDVGGVLINSGAITLAQTAVGVGTTTVGFETPISGTTINFPAKPAGSYTVATTSDIPTNGISYTGTPLAGQIAVFTNSTTAEGIAGFEYDKTTATFDIGQTVGGLAKIESGGLPLFDYDMDNQDLTVSSQNFLVSNATTVNFTQAQGFTVPTGTVGNEAVNFTQLEAKVDDTAYAGTWDGVTSIAASKNAVYDMAQGLILGNGTPAAKLERTTVGGETTWNVGQTITDAHQLVANGTVLKEGLDYTVSGTTITFEAAYLPIGVEEQQYWPNVSVVAATADTGVAVELNNPVGSYYNMASANAGTTYTTSNLALGGYAKCLINTTSEPAVTGSTKIAGATWVTGTDMYLVIFTEDGTNVKHFFLEI